MKNGLIIVIVLSILGELANVPLLELNQLAFLIFLPYASIWIFNNHYKLQINKVLIMLIACSIIAFMFLQGILFSIDYISYLKTIKNYTIVLMFIIILVNVNTDDYIDVLRKIATFASFMFMFECILWKFNSPMYYWFFKAPFSDIRNLANFLSPNSYGIILAFIIVYNFDRYIREHNKINGVMMILLFLPLGTTYSKSGLLITILGILTYIFLFKNYKIKLFLVALIFMGVEFAFSSRLLLLLKQFSDSYYIRRFILYLESNNIFGERGSSYYDLINLFRENWFTGIGFGNITGNNSIFQGMTSVHNEYLRFALEGGLVGIILFLAFIMIIIKLIFSEYQNNITERNRQLLITYSIMFVASECFYNYFNAPREGLLISFFAFGLFTCSNQKSIINKDAYAIYYKKNSNS